MTARSIGLILGFGLAVIALAYGILGAIFVGLASLVGWAIGKTIEGQLNWQQLGSALGIRRSSRA